MVTTTCAGAMPGATWATPAASWRSSSGVVPPTVATTAQRETSCGNVSVVTPALPATAPVTPSP